ncbi:Histone-lysine N-methyltransferase SETMAR [Araneus ventricosus]|uniref:Histone-lysine N-methyltransferase SETMAR n=1 Tax=Araneus ventricosus TaxID=182803 RepID=A0A4Y2BGR2_ARAVE|nr:Histone-lysine N-methyltransferase SETMAR [Araneus ventricosus]
MAGLPFLISPLRFLLMTTRSTAFSLLSKQQQAEIRPTSIEVAWPVTGGLGVRVLNPDETYATDKYCKEIDEMNCKLQRVRPILIKRKDPFHLHNNPGAHVPQIILLKLNKLCYETQPQPSCSPDLLPTDCHFLKHLDHFLIKKFFNNQNAVLYVFQKFIDFRLEILS